VNPSPAAVKGSFFGKRRQRREGKAAVEAAAPKKPAFPAKYV